MLCSKCHVLCKDVCPKCGSSRHLRESEANEPLLLMVLTAMQSMLVDPILEESGIAYYRKGLIGGALAVQVGSMRETYSYYIPYSALEPARALIEEVFGEDEAIMRALHEFDLPDAQE